MQPNPRIQFNTSRTSSNTSSEKNGKIGEEDFDNSSKLLVEKF
jgi:hypothetical protein